MSSSCLGTCSHCLAKQFWLSDTMSLQLDDGSLACLRHPGERYESEQHGLTLEQASRRGRLYRETFYVCRCCGRHGEIIQPQHATDYRETFSVCGAMKWGWSAAAVVIPIFVWKCWWEAAVIVGGTLLASPAIYWPENRKIDKALAARGITSPDAPGRFPPATGPCCPRPDWIPASDVKDDDRIPCAACGQGVMRVSQHAIH